MIKITIRGKPVAKGRPRIGKLHDGRPVAFTPKSTRKYENQIRLVAQQIMDKAPPYEGPVICRVEAFLPVPTSWSKKRQRLALEGLILPAVHPDLDQYIKTAWDALNGIVFKDDRQVVRALASKVYDEIPRLEITVREILAANTEPRPLIDKQVELEL